MEKREKKPDKHYSTKEVLDIVGIARATLYKWLRDSKVPEVYRDRNNYRIFSERDLQSLLSYKNLIKKPIESHLVRREIIKERKTTKS